MYPRNLYSLWYNDHVKCFHFEELCILTRVDSFTRSNCAQFDPLELFKKQKQMMNGTKHPFTFPFKMQVGMTTALTRAPVYEQSQLGAAADYFLIK